MLLPEAGNDQHLLPSQGKAQSIMATPKIQALAPARPNCDQKEGATLRTSLKKGRSDVTSADSKWKHVRTALYESGLDTFGRKGRQNKDWVEANWQEMEPAVKAKPAERLAYDNNLCLATRDTLKAARRKCPALRLRLLAIS